MREKEREKLAEFNKNILGVDFGFVQTKAVAESFNCKFPSLVKRRSEVVIAGLEDSEGYLITGEKGIWNVGAKGNYDFKAERMTSEGDMAKFLAVLGLFSEAQPYSTFIDLIVSGLPVDDFKIADYKEGFAKRLKGVFKFGLGNRSHMVHVHKSLVIPQSAGGFFDFILDEEGNTNPYNADLASEDVLVLDIGGKSSDGCIMENGLFSQDSFTIWEGVWKVHEELRKLIMQKHRYNVPPYKMDEVLRSGALKLGSEFIPVADLIKIAIATRFPNLRDELSLYVPDFRRFASILLCGGGAYVYHELLAEATGIPVIVLDNAEYANANGYRKYGQLKLQEGLI